MERGLFALLLSTALACTPRNEVCSYPVADPGKIVFTLAPPSLPLERTTLSGRETPLGNAVVDSYRDALKVLVDPPPIALDVVTALRTDGVCPLPEGPTERPLLLAGDISAQTLRNAMPGQDHLVVVRMTWQTLFNILEHGVTGPVGNIERTSGRFVLVSGLDYTVDCNEPPEGAAQLGVSVVRTMEGRRVRTIRFQGRVINRADALANTEPIAVAMPESLARGGDEFFDLRDAFAREGESAWSSTPVEAYSAFETYLHGLGAVAGGPVSLRTDGRMTFVNCSSTP